MKFNEVYLPEAGAETSEVQDGGGGGAVGAPLPLEQYIANAREALGVDSHASRVCSSSETESEAGDLLEQQFEEVNNRLSSATDPTGFLRMVSRNNLFNRFVAFGSSRASVHSYLSKSCVTGAAGARPASTAPQCLQ